MRHALWIVLLVAACGREGSQSEGTEPAAVPVAAKQSLISLSRDTQGLQVRNAGKAKQVRLDGTFQSAVIARRTTDGALQSECFDDAAAAESFMQVAPADVKTAQEVQ